MWAVVVEGRVEGEEGGRYNDFDEVDNDGTDDHPGDIEDDNDDDGKGRWRWHC